MQKFNVNNLINKTIEKYSSDVHLICFKIVMYVCDLMTNTKI